MKILNSNSSVFINGSCDECLCIMLNNPLSISSFNCFRNNATCETFSPNITTRYLLLTNNVESSVYFSSLPINDSITSGVQTIGDVVEGTTIIANCTSPTPNIRILNAFYGVRDDSGCLCYPTGCIEMNVTQNITSYCATSSSSSTCQFVANNLFFSDPCYGYSKIFSLKYDCTN
ncbi:unnamed protein product [Adineta ricciae]|uniref:SUEL-type lectin domain-containing protein n=1 Tax=Adineta ricciae TaxID=249248 RepID=A0A816CPM4_ADIRI|nr:unnamed protein product [Adineta ricciae]CAF1624500.1 unnamed protein product [Adineta ricciae]